MTTTVWVVPESPEYVFVHHRFAIAIILLSLLILVGYLLEKELRKLRQQIR